MFFMLKCAANSYRLALECALENCSPDVINYHLDNARYYDEQAKLK